MRRERAMVPEAEFRSYYGRPVIKAPIWHEPHMPTYLYLGGMSGASSLLAVMARYTGRPRLGRTARIAAAAGSAAGAVLLAAELGRPERFLNMLRVFKVTSPMSVGSWILAAQGGLSAVAATSELTGILPVAGDAAVLATGLTGPLTATYTAVLVADTAVPAWHEAYRELPFLFAGSALASAGAVGLLAAPHAEAAPARLVAVAGAALETAAGVVMERRLGLLGEPYQLGRAGRLMRAARVLTVGGGALAAVSGRGRTLAVLSGLALTAGALCTRFGILEAGRASAADPKYTVIPQRQRLDARAEPSAAPPDEREPANLA
ncbi:NrfD/PsrC family molybdoenzyme membrane anchor subunit [Nonomuraea cavernae]|uniref:Polysulfide reductase n=1 Tax=Nonomuraea cavernae TaxID=2045107 RepID=A0A917YP07_9ACTN|nr:NrfD/PsrC family molybdoenzyme membrane anchor subunit [Nonomuraea cavernae]MCA2183984.1 polysulfide reductase NrfD [Nonomuraea cavernae]GGO61979.1 polysulfide reductase [Nonomuraea cavernae]